MAHGTKLNPTLRAFIERQQMFFVATAAATGRVNVSPKGADSLRLLSDTRLRWLNLSGSGNETAAHLRESPRMTLMFCAFDGDPLILRCYGEATALHPFDDGWDEAAKDFSAMAGSRQIFEMEIKEVQTSCGTGVPLMEHTGERVDSELVPYFDAMGPEGVEAYWRKKNTQTIDGFPTGLFEE
ncbi:MAG: pyridoxamine 5'-phosphate oxidase family protein [Pseudomonadota bacterium]